MAINSPCGQDHALTRDNFCGRANNNRHVVLGIGITRFTDLLNSAVFDAHIGFDNAPPI